MIAPTKLKTGANPKMGNARIINSPNHKSIDDIDPLFFNCYFLLQDKFD